jgi:RNA polymerase sigma factor (sigma-70 family)
LRSKTVRRADRTGCGCPCEDIGVRRIQQVDTGVAVPRPSAAPVRDGQQRTDEELVRAVVAGATPAFAALYDRYGGRAYSLARRVCADDGLAEDVVQEAFLGFWRAPERFDPQRGRFSSWLLTLVHHRAVDAVRRQSAASRRTVPPLDDDVETAAAGPGADQDALAAVEAAQIRDALRLLPDDQRSALALAYFGGFTQREIAVRLGVPLGTVKSRMFTGIRRLRDLLGPTLGAAGEATGGGPR